MASLKSIGMLGKKETKETPDFLVSPPRYIYCNTAAFYVERSNLP